MAKAAEHGKPPAVVRVIELVGVSSKSWSDAAQQAVTLASKTLRHITGLDVLLLLGLQRFGMRTIEAVVLVLIRVEIRREARSWRRHWIWT